MQFLLTALNAKYIHSNPAVYSLRAYAGLENRKHIEIAEYTINNSITDILAGIYQRKPDVIGFSCYIWNISMVLELVVELNKVLPELPIWLGGPEVSFDAPKLLENYPMITGIMIGEGEETFKELLTYYIEKETDKNNQEKGLHNIAGLCLPDGYTAPRDIADMSKLPFLYDSLDEFRNKIIYYESSRGCPYSCSYCLSSIDKKVRLRNLELVEKELQFFLDHWVKQVKFVDRTFNCHHGHATAIWKYIKEHDNGITNFHFEVSADILNEEEISILNSMRPGLVQLEIGVQSTNPETIKAINRTMKVEKLEEIVARIHEGKNVHMHLDLIAGLPYEDYTSFGRSFNRVYAMKPEQLQLGFLKVLKGSAMHDKAGEYGIAYLDKAPYEVLFTNWLSFEEVLQLKRIEEMVEIYYNSNQFVYTIACLEKEFATPFEMYEALAAFYERNGFFVNTPSRVYRYQVLLQFAKERAPEKEELFKELLTYDLYLRENLKSRPEFARDMLAFKEEIREIKQTSKLTHVEAFDYAVWNALEGEVEKLETTKLCLFDYQERNPLTFEAKVILL